jgi:Domain of unknown function (DUF1737)
MKITKYLTVAGASLKELDEAVNEYLSQGFQPYGNPYVSDAGEDSGVADPFLYAQAMVQHS